MAELNLNVVLLGAHRSGKSSSLCLMIDSLNRIHSDIQVRYLNELVEDMMRKKNRELIDIFSSHNIYREEWFDDELSDDKSFDSYSYIVEYKKKLKINLCCTDISVSGETINDFMSGTYIHLADVIIVAIDTPQLVENGYRGKIANCVSNVIDLIKTNTSGVGGTISKQLLFVPMKCEKYVHSGQMNYVVDAIKNTYADLFLYWKKCNIPAYIVPIQTLGDLEFSHISGQRFCYKYVGNKNYSPCWCEQPLIYSIRYLINKKCLTLK
ncbi:MAG: hypothetical protein IKY72_07355 [Bacteroidaceae bacterium]|nr:hypothetical protein [Bacteroidaceae bacterium]